jgi:transcriptional regulator GlxA family with amidase domain
MLLFPGFTALDAFGPYHALAHLPGREFVFVAEEAGPVSDGGRITVTAQAGIDEIDRCDVLVVPGGIPAVTMARAGHRLVEWIRAVHPTTTWTASVCTGALMLGAAGVLDGLPATTHWYCHDELARYGAIPTNERVVFAGKVVTAAGVSAGIDMALRLTEILADTRYAQATQLDMEYAPEPPFTSGHPSTAPAEVTEWLRSMYDSMLAEPEDPPPAA